jgi:Cd2+/Zn2+-exporting ATPase
MKSDARLLRKVSLEVHGMHCAEEVALLRRELEPIPGVAELSFDILNARLTATLTSPELSSATLIQRVQRTGMGARELSDQPAAQPHEATWLRSRGTLLAAASGSLLVGGLLVDVAGRGLSEAFSGHDQGAPSWLVRTLYLAATLCGAWQVLPRAARAARRLRPDMNLLMVVAIAGALALGDFLEGATVAFLFAVSLALEAWSVGRARRAIAALMAVAPDTARVFVAPNNEQVVPVADVPLHSRILVRPGEKIPLDGTVRTGNSEVNQAPVTGESIPVPKTPGNEAFAGTINGSGVLEIETSRLANDTTVARIARLVGDAQSKRAPSEQWVERFASYYTPAVMLLAIAVALVPPLFGASFSRWFYEALVLLVIACPCALVISTPVTIVAALTSAARQGVLIKGGPFLEAPAQLRVIAIDKTGTLTQGTPQLTQIVPWNGADPDQILAVAAALERHSNHPLAQAVVTAAADRHISPAAADQIQSLAGRGITGRLANQSIWVGSHRLLEERGIETPDLHQALVQLEQTGASVVVVGSERSVLGLIALADQPRPEARQAVDQLRAAGIERVVMLTGDNRATAEAIAQATGVDSVQSQLLPEDKVQAVESLSAQFGRVAMVGDGVNDAPAMARAHLGIAMGVAGTDAAIETADIALMTDDLLRLPWLVQHSRRALRVIRQNIAVSLGIKAIFVALTIAGYATLWGAIAADTGASLLVIFNGLTMLRTSFPART